MRAIYALMAVVFFLSVQGCKQCIECSKYPAPTEKLCKKDFASDDSYSQAFHYLEGNGYDCK